MSKAYADTPQGVRSLLIDNSSGLRGTFNARLTPDLEKPGCWLAEGEDWKALVYVGDHPLAPDFEIVEEPGKAMNPLAILEELAAEVDGAVRSYSGRFMYGARCWGVTVPNLAEGIHVAGRLGLPAPQTDNMGMDYILYWPAFKVGEDVR